MLCRKVTLLPVKNQGTALFFYSFNLNRLFRLFFVGIVGYVRTYHLQGGSLKTIGQLKVSIYLFAPSASLLHTLPYIFAP